MMGRTLCGSTLQNFIMKILDIYLKMLPRLSHIKLPPFSVMRVNLAAHILSKSVSLVLKNYCLPDVAGKAIFCEMFDSFFDCFNVRSIKEHTRKKKTISCNIYNKR